ncbi:hypothetical protein HJG60_011448 [Phyllostomus discolor]|uniref:Uncharacterized protein n=1 Tax=Phyllostomus discolor TaxID=89673 RepID=A0A834E5M0_9CHIR|nr:hypothetical protein HJG60_011448 [Phyllostomus discolor]
MPPQADTNALSSPTAGHLPCIPPSALPPPVLPDQPPTCHLSQASATQGCSVHPAHLPLTDLHLEAFEVFAVCPGHLCSCSPQARAGSSPEHRRAEPGWGPPWFSAAQASPSLSPDLHTHRPGAGGGHTQEALCWGCCSRRPQPSGLKRQMSKVKVGRVTRPLKSVRR